MKTRWWRGESSKVFIDEVKDPVTYMAQKGGDFDFEESSSSSDEDGKSHMNVILDPKCVE